MARRSSARLRNRNSSTPKRVSLSGDVLLHTPRTAPVKLERLPERDEMPGAFPGSVSPPVFDVNKYTKKVPLNPSGSTPKQSTPIAPAPCEMSPKHHQQSTAKPMDEARWLGFSRMAPHTEPAKRGDKIAQLQGTPTKTSNDATLSTFKFTFGREQSLELSPEAKKLMCEKREEALKIREQMIADGEGSQDRANVKSRTFAIPKGKKNRFSEVHLEQFKKMDSIAGHASAFRANASKSKAASDLVESHVEEPSAGTSAVPARSLKRSPSKAGLSDPEQPVALKRVNTSDMAGSPAANVKNRLTQTTTITPPGKRLKRAEFDGARTVYSTTAVNKTLLKSAEASSLSKIASPTEASLARSGSIQSTKLSKIPGPATTPKSSHRGIDDNATNKSHTPLLARTPTKAPHSVQQSAAKTGKMLSPLLMRTPSRFSPLRREVESEGRKEMDFQNPPLLSRSPVKISGNELANPGEAEQTSLLRGSIMSRTPKKTAVCEAPNQNGPKQETGTVRGETLMSRFNLLRSSPMKSILRSPQRLYSDDPAKVAAGTHLASPAGAASGQNKAPAFVPDSGTPVEKHVDFTSSTKARYERAQSELDSTPSQDSLPQPTQGLQTKPPTSAAFANYPQLPTGQAEASPTFPKRRQPAAPGDFTFTSHGRDIIFGQTPNTPATGLAENLPSTIRQVSAEPRPTALNSEGKKRKYKFDNTDAVLLNEAKDDTSDKENGGVAEDERPTKRIRSTAPESATAAVPKKRPTLGVKPKKGTKDTKEKKPSVISRARLNALAQPKRRV